MPSRPGNLPAPPPLWPFLVLCVLVALVIDFGSFHQCQHADSLLHVFVSLYHWTPFYWELDRVGMLVPLLAKPFTDPLANLLVQCALYISFGLAAFFLLARYVLRDATYPLVATLGAALFLACTPPYYRFEFFLNAYGVWLTLGLGGLLLLERQPDGRVPWKRGLLALLLLTLAHWVYCTAALFLGPLVLFRCLAFPRQPAPDAPGASLGTASRCSRLMTRARLAARSEMGLSLLLMGVAGAAGMVFMTFSRYHRTDLGTLPVAEWPAAWRELLDRTWVNLAPQVWPVLLALSAGTGVLLLAVRIVRARASPALRAALALAAAATVIGLFMGTRAHVRANLFMFRFLAPSVFFLQCACLLLALLPLRALLAARALQRLSLLAAPLLLAAALFRYGPPSLAQVRTDLSQAHVPTLTGIARLDGVRIEDLLDTGCTHVAGQYWTVWPAVYNANRLLHERGANTILWAVSLRSRPTQRDWSKIPLEEMRIAVPVGDAQAAAYLADYGFPPLVVLEKRATVWILRPQTVGPGKGG